MSPKGGAVPDLGRERRVKAARARDFAEFIGWLRVAVERLRSAGLDYRARVRTLRGVYYGTRHSLDYEKCRSVLRNLGFNLYLRALPPRDPSPLLGADLVRHLKDSTELPHDGRLMDVGHVFVGLEARLSLPARRLNVLAQGGTGLELATWVGDLGGAAGLLAVGRMDAPRLRALGLLFSPDFYDLRTNLEGDLAGYLVARDPGAGLRPSSPALAGCPTVPEALERYLAGRPSDWSQRHRLFARMIGGECEGARLANREAFKRAVESKLAAFASFYLVYRLRHLGRLSGAAVREAARHVRGAASEISEIFLGLLEQGLAGRRDAPDTLPDPDPSAAASPATLARLLGLAGVLAPGCAAPHPWAGQA